MSLAAALLLAAAAVQAEPAEASSKPDRGAEVETGRISATILRSGVLERGVLVSGKSAATPHSQRRSEGGRVIYTFE